MDKGKPLSDEGGHDTIANGYSEKFYIMIFARKVSKARVGRHTVAGLAACLALSLAGSAAAQSDMTGLWWGQATLESVSAPGETTAVPAAGAMRLPVLIHVDGAGQAVLLKQAVILPGEDGSRIIADPVRHLAVLRSAAPEALAAAVRLESAGFAFEGDRVPVEGVFGLGGRLTAVIDIAPDSSANPFFHRFHPDHDNRDAEGRKLADDSEVYALSRAIRIDLADPAPGTVMAGASVSGAAQQIVAAYAETISGLAAEPVTVRGRLVLTRVDDSGELE